MGKEKLYFEKFYSVVLGNGAENNIHLKQQLQTICLRSLILEMHWYKNNGLLKKNMFISVKKLLERRSL